MYVRGGVCAVCVCVDIHEGHSAFNEAHFVSNENHNTVSLYLCNTL